MSKKTLEEIYADLDKTDKQEADGMAAHIQRVADGQREGQLSGLQTIMSYDVALFIGAASNILSDVGQTYSDINRQDKAYSSTPSVTPEGIELLNSFKKILQGSPLAEHTNIILGKIINDAGLSKTEGLPPEYQQMAREEYTYSAARSVEVAPPEKEMEALVKFGEDAYTGKHTPDKFQELLSPFTKEAKAEVILSVYHKLEGQRNTADLTNEKQELSNLYDKEVRGIERPHTAPKQNTAFDTLMDQMTPKEFGRLLASNKTAPSGIHKTDLDTLKNAANVFSQNKIGSPSTGEEANNLLKNLTMPQMQYLQEAVRANESFEQKSTIKQICSKVYDACVRLFNSEKNEAIKAGVGDLLSKANDGKDIKTQSQEIPKRRMENGYSR